MAHVWFLFICAVWGSSFILMDRAVQAMGPVTIGVCRLLVGGLTITAYLVWTRRRWEVSAKDWPHILLVGLLANAYPFVLQPYVMSQAGEHGYFGMMVALVPLLTILLSIPMLGVYPTRRQLVGVLGGLVCIAGIVQEGSARGIAPWVIVLALTVPVSYALGNTYIKRYLDGVPAAPLTALFLLLGGLPLLPLRAAPGMLSAIGLGEPVTPQGWPVALAAIVFLSVVGTGVAILLFIRLIKSEGPLFAGMVTYVIPVLALVWGQVDRERLSALQVGAILGVLAMVALVQWPARATEAALAKARADSPRGPECLD